MVRLEFQPSSFLLIILWITWEIVLGPGETLGGTIRGTITFKGEVQPPLVIDITRDVEVCGKKKTIQPLLVDEKSHGVKDVIVHVDLEKADKPVTGIQDPRISISTKNCAFQARVNTMAAGHSIDLVNEDPILHNTHVRNEKRTVLNVAQVPGGRTISKRIKRPGLLKMKCDKHYFMRGFLGAFWHPYHFVTNEFGEFRLGSVPPGEYELVIWHEVLGTLTKAVTVPAQDKQVEINFQYPDIEYQYSLDD